jgi:hypothetical protein
MTTKLELMRALASFSPAAQALAEAPWPEYVDWSIGQGLAPLAAYNLEYRLVKSGAPQWARDRLLSVYQGTANDNVMKLVSLKRALDPLHGRRVVVLGGASYTDSLYPHVAFRPVIDLPLFVAPDDAGPMAGFLRRADFRPDASETRQGPLVLTDTRTAVLLHPGLLGPPFDDELLAAALPFPVYGPSALKLPAEEALLVQVLLMARVGFDVPLLEFIDLRELVAGAPAINGPQSRPLDAAKVRGRAAAWGLERALWAALTATAQLFPEVQAAVEALQPGLPEALRDPLARSVVAPLVALGDRAGLDAGAAMETLPVLR